MSALWMFAALKAGTCKGRGKKKGEREDGGAIYESIEGEGGKNVCIHTRAVTIRVT